MPDMVAEAVEPARAVTPAQGVTHVSAPVTASQKLAVLVGLVLLAAGAFGFIASSSFDTGSGIDSGSLLGFDVNGWSNLLHLLAGLLLLAVSPNRALTRAAWRLIAFAALISLLAGLIDGDDVFGLVPVNTLDKVGDAVLLVIAIIGARAAKEQRPILEQDRLLVDAPDGPGVVGPGSGHVGGPRGNVARIDAKL